MGTYTIKLPDVGEGVAEAELVEWQVEVGDIVAEDDVIGAVMTDKATVEIPSPVQGTISWLGAEIGDTISVGVNLVKLEVIGATNERIAADDEDETIEILEETEALVSSLVKEPRQLAPRVLAAPAVRQRAEFLRLDLSRFDGSGPDNIVTHEDLDKHLLSLIEKGSGVELTPYEQRDDGVTKEIKVIGLRRKIAEQMSRSKSRIPHITYVEEVDVTELEQLRQNLNNSREEGQTKLSILPFLMRSLVLAIAEQPALNAHFDDQNGIIHQHDSVHIGIAAQTENGLMVPVVRHAQKLGLWQSAREIARLAEAARNNSATREELSGSTITISSLGKLGGVASTPVINHPEVAIIGVNKITTKPEWNGSQFVPRQMMNLSSSFDHRVIDGFDAAIFIQRLKSFLEKPLLIFS